MTSCRSDMQRTNGWEADYFMSDVYACLGYSVNGIAQMFFLATPATHALGHLCVLLFLVVLLWWQWQSWWETDNRVAVVWCQDRFNKTNERNHDTRWWKDFSAWVCDKDDSSFDVRDCKERVDGAFCPRQLLKGVEGARKNKNRQRWGKSR